jgi:hypothetical protein
MQLNAGGSSEASNDTPPTSGVNANTIRYQDKQMTWVLKHSSSEKKKEQIRIFKANETANGGHNKPTITLKMLFKLCSIQRRIMCHR